MISTHKEEIIDFNTSQLTRGVDSNNSKLNDYQSDVYYNFKRSEGLATAGRTYNFFLTGEFYEGFEVTIRGDEAFIDSNDSKRNYLVSLSSEDIFGLTDENLNEYIQEYFRPEFNDRVRKELGLAR